MLDSGEEGYSPEYTPSSPTYDLTSPDNLSPPHWAPSFPTYDSPWSNGLPSHSTLADYDQSTPGYGNSSDDIDPLMSVDPVAFKRRPIARSLDYTPRGPPSVDLDDLNAASTSRRRACAPRDPRSSGRPRSRSPSPSPESGLGAPSRYRSRSPMRRYSDDRDSVSNKEDPPFSSFIPTDIYKVQLLAKLLERKLARQTLVHKESAMLEEMVAMWKTGKLLKTIQYAQDYDWKEDFAIDAVIEVVETGRWDCADVDAIKGDLNDELRERMPELRFKEKSILQRLEKQKTWVESATRGLGPLGLESSEMADESEATL